MTITRITVHCPVCGPIEAEIRLVDPHLPEPDVDALIGRFLLESHLATEHGRPRPPKVVRFRRGYENGGGNGH